MTANAPIVILTGASGVGKTTIALAIQDTHPEFSVFRFDTIGVPSPEIMASYGPGHQPGGTWQRAITLQWFERLAPIVASGRPVLFEGQMRIAFILEALAAQNFRNASIVLVECDDDTRNSRLIQDRQQPELANESMRGWSRYLHQEAIENRCAILDTGATSLSAAVARVVFLLKA